jgi:hypothetical protein
MDDALREREQLGAGAGARTNALRKLRDELESPADADSATEYRNLDERYGAGAGGRVRGAWAPRPSARHQPDGPEDWLARSTSRFDQLRQRRKKAIKRLRLIERSVARAPA